MEGGRRREREGGREMEGGRRRERGGEGGRGLCTLAHVHVVIFSSWSECGTALSHTFCFTHTNTLIGCDD